MAKVSVYIPDDLLEEAKAADADLPLSNIVRDALRARLSATQARPFAELTDNLRRQRDLARQIVRARVTEAHQQGYAVGLGFARHLPWSAFEDFARGHWSLPSWHGDFDEKDYEDAAPSAEERERGTLLLDFESTINQAMAETHRIPIEENTAGFPVGVPAEGFVDAIRDVWAGAQPSTIDAAPSSAGGEIHGGSNS